MTTQRRDGQGTPFGLWLRRQNAIDSKQGFIATDIDYIWKNYITNEWMLLEEKRKNTPPTKSQLNCLGQIDFYLRASRLYCGCYVIVFENTMPDDGDIWFGKVDMELAFKLKIISKDGLLSFLRFEHADG